MALIEIEGLRNLKMVDLSMAMLNNQRVSVLVSNAEVPYQIHQALLNKMAVHGHHGVPTGGMKDQSAAARTVSRNDILRGI